MAIYGWTVELLLIEVAAILVRLEHDRNDDALYIAKRVVGDTKYHEAAKSIFNAEESLLLEEQGD